MTYILGINAYHGDSSACLLKDGEIIAAAEEERFKRIKHWAGFPSESITYCLYEAKITLKEVEHIAINSDPNANFSRKVIYSLQNRLSFKFLFNRFVNKRKKKDIEDEFKRFFHKNIIKSKIHHIEHHLSHLASAHYASPFEKSIALSVDGFGDFSSGAWGIGSKEFIEIKDRIHFPHSLGIFYQALTQFIGFPNYGDEYKVMGLAPYGKPTFLEKMRKIVHLRKNGSYSLNLNLFRHYNENIKYEWNNCSPSIANLFNDNLANFLEVSPRSNNQPLEQVHYDIAHSTQAMYEEAFFNLLNTVFNKNKIENLTLAGGCAMNSVANGKIYRRSKYKNVYIQSAAGDAGGAIGCAYVVAAKLRLLNGSSKMEHAYLGPHFDNEFHRDLINRNRYRIEKSNCDIEFIENDKELCSLTAKAISNGNIIGWFQGRMEWGPRALGNRSILGDPRRSDMKNILNLKIKRRESFRPFAPSIMREYVPEWFEEDDDVPFMMQVFQIKKNKRNIIPAVTHVDGSGRLQTVEQKTNKKYYMLINEFMKITGVPILLNTSFNENEPVVCHPEEALKTFLRTKMDILVLGNWIIKRKSLE